MRYRKGSMRNSSWPKEMQETLQDVIDWTKSVVYSHVEAIVERMVLEDMEETVTGDASGVALTSRSPASDSPITAVFTQPLTPEAQLLAYKMFELYHRQMMPLFPFVWISLDESPEKLFRERPMLYMAIMVVACQQNVDAQQELAQRWREELGRRIWAQGEKNLHLLQGLGPQLNNLMHTAMSLAEELGISREKSMSTKTSPGGLNDYFTTNQGTREKTNEERRCYLGLFWINSVLRMCVKDTCPLPGGQSIEEARLALQQAAELPCDEYLVQLVRVHQVANIVDKTLYQDLSSTEVVLPGAVLMAVSHLEKEVEAIKSSLPQALPQQEFLLMSCHVLQIFLYKVGMDDRLLQSMETPSSSAFSLRLSDVLASCLSAVKAETSSVLSLANSVILSMPYPYWIQLGHAILIFSRLLTTHHNFWDPGLLTSIQDFTDTLEALSQKLEGAMSEAINSYPPRFLPTVFTKLRERFINICKRVEETSRANTQMNLGSTEPSVSDMFDPGNMAMDEQTEALLFSFFTDGLI
ncbi:uncharacterized protein NECHADRAFT_101769 [Fusarium vanettenii 77-13-4]|uniref:Transcription factor domain-containing protein n=1 Tax=Fusarium vanettenii (strain ATCC MYA-4622 / CBS 123669 / FGSC 9596 / NRRL 45880 / 77-13-4) TaxID=660122 RepID=C7ZNZ1_FUSV7|nr:uncharacterized protein NECHADRAFT_101769 [Fusarium vanettenii 77-13-4]EEU34191.1 hypothetical protein NECHADRAFT_101769 [Fusarium vanettenii 77-13-4]